jgi:hypothetical protein
MSVADLMAEYRDYREAGNAGDWLDFLRSR